jgi:hypothetical protein
MSLKNRSSNIKREKNTLPIRKDRKLITKTEIKKMTKQKLQREKIINFFKQLLTEKNINLREYYKLRINQEVLDKKLNIMLKNRNYSNLEKAKEIINNYRKQKDHYLNKFLKLYANDPKNISKEALQYFKLLNEIVVLSQKVDRIEALEEKTKTVFTKISKLKMFQEKRII